MAEFHKIAKAGDVAPGEVGVYEVEGHRVALCNVDGEFYAIEDVCTHDAGPLDQGELIGSQIKCPRHGAKFDVTTGKALTLPAVKPVPKHDVKIEGDDVYVHQDLRDTAGDWRRSGTTSPSSSGGSVTRDSSTWTTPRPPRNRGR